MGSQSFSTRLLYSVLVAVFLHAAHAAAFGAGNIASISAIEGQNWRHGDIEDTLLQLFLARVAGGKRFSKMDVKRVYFGNWLRDYSQAVDVGSVKYVSAEAVRLILWVLGFMSFGYGTGAFEVTRDRLGCYRPEEHIDNPKDYADNLDARRYDRRLRGPVDERRELSIDTRTGLKHYIATEDVGITTSAALVRDLYGRCIQLGRRYGHSRKEADLFEAFRLLGTANHCLEDYAAHSNYVELALREMGERDVFPLVGRRTEMNLPGAQGRVFPVVTGTFGGVDFLHSVMGEFQDKATQSEIQQLSGTVQHSQSGGNFSLLRDLLSKIPSGVFGGKDHAGEASQLQMNAQAARMENMNISPRQPEAWAKWLDSASRQIYPVLQWHDEIMLQLNEMVEKIPVLPQLIEQLTEQINIFVFSLLGPFILPVINQVKTELSTGSSEVINSSRNKQLNVFVDDACTDPTHSMLSKDHFSNVLNEPAGKVSSQVLRWVIPQIMACWDDERIDVKRTLDRIVRGTFHHPALRDQGADGAVDGRRGMFTVVEKWWRTKPEEERRVLRSKLSRDGVQKGRNHKEGVVDTGHGCGKPLGMPTRETAGSSGAIGGLVGGLMGSDVLSQIGSALGGQSGGGVGAGTSRGTESFGGVQRGVGGQHSGGGGLGVAGGIAGGLVVGGLAGAVGAELLGGGERRDRPYGGAVYNQTNYASGTEVREYDRYQQTGAGWEERTETRYEAEPGARGWQSEVREERFGPGGEYEQDERRYVGGGYGGERVEETTTYGGGLFGGNEVVEETTSYGGGRYGGGETVEETTTYGGGLFGGNEVVEETTSYGGGRYGGGETVEETTTYGGGLFGGNEVVEETTSYGGGRYGGGETVEETTTYGGGLFGGNEVVEETTSYGGGRYGGGETVEETTTYGGGLFGGNEVVEETTSYGGGGYGGGETVEETTTYGGGLFGGNEVVEETTVYDDNRFGGGGFREEETTYEDNRYGGGEVVEETTTYEDNRYGGGEVVEETTTYEDEY